MYSIRIANAPCSWRVMMGFAAEAPFPPYAQVLDEMVETGYEGTELGDWGYLPTDAAMLSEEIERRGLAMVGARSAAARGPLTTRRVRRDGFAYGAAACCLCDG